MSEVRPITFVSVLISTTSTDEVNGYRTLFRLSDGLLATTCGPNFAGWFCIVSHLVKASVLPLPRRRCPSVPGRASPALQIGQLQVFRIILLRKKSAAHAGTV